MFLLIAVLVPLITIFFLFLSDPLPLVFAYFRLPSQLHPPNFALLASLYSEFAPFVQYGASRNGKSSTSKRVKLVNEEHSVSSEELK